MAVAAAGIALSVVADLPDVDLRDAPGVALPRRNEVEPRTGPMFASPMAPSDNDTPDRVMGVLPDGTRYVITGLGLQAADPTGVSVVVMYLPDNGEWRALGISNFSQGGTTPSPAPPRWDDRTLLVSAGRWTLRVSVYEDIFDRLGSRERAAMLAQFADMALVRGLPVVRFEPPLRWGYIEDVPAYLKVHYPGFAVRRGCPTTRPVTCSPDRAVHLVEFDRGGPTGQLLEGVTIAHR